MKAKTTALFALLIVFTLGFSACSKKQEGCTDPTASNYNVNAEVDNGTCQYDPRDQYVGNYWILDSLWTIDWDSIWTQNGVEYLTLAYNYISDTNCTLTVSKDPNDSSQIILEQLWGDGDDFVAVLTGSNFTVPTQFVTTGPNSGYKISGAGSFTGNVVKYETSANFGQGIWFVPWRNRGKGTKPS